MLFDVSCRYPVRLWWVCLASDHIPDPRFLSKFMRSHARSIARMVVFLLLLLDHPFIRCWFCCMSCLSQVMILQVILLVLMKPQHFSDGEQDSADFWTLSLHLAEYFFFIVWWLYLYYSKWPRYRWQISVNSGTQKSKHHHIIFIFTILMYLY